MAGKFRRTQSGNMSQMLAQRAAGSVSDIAEGGGAFPIKGSIVLIKLEGGRFASIQRFVVCLPSSLTEVT